MSKKCDFVPTFDREQLCKLPPRERQIVNDYLRHRQLVLFVTQISAQHASVCRWGSWQYSASLSMYDTLTILAKYLPEKQAFALLDISTNISSGCLDSVSRFTVDALADVISVFSLDVVNIIALYASEKREQVFENLIKQRLEWHLEALEDAIETYDCEEVKDTKDNIASLMAVQTVDELLERASGRLDGTIHSLFKAFYPTGKIKIPPARGKWMSDNDDLGFETAS